MEEIISSTNLKLAALNQLGQFSHKKDFFYNVVNQENLGLN